MGGLLGWRRYRGEKRRGLTCTYLCGERVIKSDKGDKEEKSEVKYYIVYKSKEVFADEG